jgi:hypothetical protein
MNFSNCLQFAVITSYFNRHYISQHIVRVSVVSVQAMKAYGEVEKQLQSFSNSARDGASSQVHTLAVYFQRNILSPPPCSPSPYTLNRGMGGLRRRYKVLAAVGGQPMIFQTADRSLAITLTKLPRSIWSLYKCLCACRITVVRSSCVLLPSVKQAWTGFPSTAERRHCC